MCFSSPSKNYFLAPLGRFRTPKSRRIEFSNPFLAPPWILRDPQNRPKSPKWRQNGSQIISGALTFWGSKNRLASKVVFGPLLGVIFVIFD